MKRIALIILLLASTLVAPAQPPPAPKPLPVFTVKGKPVLTDEFIYLYRKNNQNKAAEFTEAKVNDYINLLINFKLKVAEALSRGLDTTAGFEKEFASYREELKRPFVASNDDVNRLVNEAYDRMKLEVKAAHILITLKPESTPADTLDAWNRITALRQRALAGEDFYDLARQYSEDPSAKSNGGDLGYFSSFQMVYPFESAAYTTRKGEISSIVRTRFGYHILHVDDVRPASGEVEVSHILIRTGRGDDSKARNKIFDAFDQLKAGRSWDDVVKEFTEDPGTRDTGGKLRPFGHGGVGVPGFENAAFAMQQAGELTDPFQTPFGWHILRLERKIPVPAFAEVEATLKRKVSRDERLQLSKANRLKAQKKAAGFAADQQVQSSVMKLADTLVTRGQWRYRGDATLAAKTLFSLNGKPVTVREFVRYVSRNQSAGTGTPESQLNKYYEQFVENRLSLEEDQQLMAANPEFRNLVNEYREGILLFEIMEKEVWNRASADSAGQLKYFNSHQDKYKAGDRVRARLFTTTDKPFFDGVLKKVQAGDTLSAADMKRFKSVIPFRSYEKGESKIIDLTPWTIGVHAVEREGSYHLVQIESLQPPGLKSFAEARAHVIADFQDQMEQVWLKGLRKKFGVKINSKGKAYVIQQLTSK